MNLLKDAFNRIANEVFIFTMEILATFGYLFTASSILFTAVLNWPKFYFVLKN